MLTSEPYWCYGSAWLSTSERSARALPPTTGERSALASLMLIALIAHIIRTTEPPIAGPANPPDLVRLVRTFLQEHTFRCGAITLFWTEIVTRPGMILKETHWSKCQNNPLVISAVCPASLSDSPLQLLTELCDCPLHSGPKKRLKHSLEIQVAKCVSLDLTAGRFRDSASTNQQHFPDTE
jgi:hypothetical protein